MRAMRIALITGGLMAAGAVFGGGAGVVAGAAWVLVEEGGGGVRENAEILRVMGVLGGMLGAVLGPAAAWLLMRHVPLWLAVGGTTLSTMAGGILGSLLGGLGLTLWSGLAGFLISAAYLQIWVPDRGRLPRDGGVDRLPVGGG
jgi:hypothetical protein